MRVTLFMAVSLNGLIARPTGDEDFLSHKNWLCFKRALKEFGCLIWGRKTYEAVIKWGGSYMREMGGITKVVVSKTKSFSPKPGWTKAASATQAVRILKRKGFTRALLCGGAVLNSAFARAGLIDKIRVNIEPVVVGEGLNLFSPAKFDCRLKLLSIKRTGAGILTLEYAVV